MIAVSYWSYVSRFWSAGFSMVEAERLAGLAVERDARRRELAALLTVSR